MGIEGFMKMDAGALQNSIKQQEDKMAKVEKDLEDLLKSLQAQYEEGQKKRDDEKKKIKESGLGLMKSVAAYQKKTEKRVVRYSVIGNCRKSSSMRVGPGFWSFCLILSAM